MKVNSMQENKKNELDVGYKKFSMPRRHLRKAHDKVIRLIEQDERDKQKTHDHLNNCRPTLFKAADMLNINLPLHRKLKNVCRQHLTFKKKMRATKQELQEALQEKQKERKGVLNLLAKAAKI